MAAAAVTPGYLSGSLSGLAGQGQAAFEAPSLGSLLLNTFLALAFVLALFYVAAWFYRRLRAGRGITDGMKGGGAGAFQVLETTWLDAKRGLALVELDGSVYFLGLGEDVSLLSRIDDPKAVEGIRGAAPSQGGLLNFQEQLQRVGLALKREQWKKSKQELKAGAGELGEQIERLKPKGKKEAS